jgi:oxygen-independent coproporphyrinogen-3 oxidase
MVQRMVNGPRTCSRHPNTFVACNLHRWKWAASWHKENFPASPAAQTVRRIDRQAEIGETMMMGLRLTAEGVSNRVFERRFHQPLEQVFSTEIKDLIEKGLLEWTGETTDSLRLTRRGRLLGNQVFMRFI